MGWSRWLVLLGCLAGCAPRCGPSSAGADHGWTPLHRAALHSEVARVQELAQGVALEARDALGMTPLHLAARAGHVDAVALLLQRGANVEARARYDMTPLHWAALRGQAGAVQALLRGGAQVATPNLYGMAALHMAGSAEVVRLLLDAGAPLEAKDVRGMTPLHFARAEPVAKALLDRGANVNVRSRAGLTPMQMTGVAACSPHGLVVYPFAETLRLRGDLAQVELLLWNVGDDEQREVRPQVAHPAVATHTEPAQLAQIYPGQLVALTMTLQRRTDQPPGRSPFALMFEAGDGTTLARCNLTLDTRAEETPEDRGVVPVGTITLRAAPGALQYLAYGALPLVLAVAWLVVRWRERRQVAGRQ